MAGLDDKRDKRRGRRSPAGRKAGKPRSAERPIGPAEQAMIARLHLRHVPIGEIADQLGVAESTIRHHLDHNIRPAWMLGIARAAEIELAKIDELERIAWVELEKGLVPETQETVKEILAAEGGNGETIERVIKTLNRTTTVWAQVIQWCISERCRIKGYYAAQRLRADQGGTVRVAGKTREDINQELHERIAYLLENHLERKRLVESYVAH